MSTGKIIGYIAAGILVFFGVLWLWSAFSGTGSPGGRLLVGGLLVLIGLGIIVAIFRNKESVSVDDVNLLKG